jgi:hypothetical protein
VLEGEKAARSDAARRLREAEKAAAAAAAPALPLSPAAAGLTPPPAGAGALAARRAALQAAVDEHSRQVPRSDPSCPLWHACRLRTPQNPV